MWTGLASFFSTLESTFADAQLLIFLVGNFSKDGGQGVHALASYTAGFNRLAALVSSHKTLLKVASFVIMPGPSDPSPIDAFPRPPLPPSVVKQFTEKVLQSLVTSFSFQFTRSQVPGTVVGSNPMRLRFFSQEIVFFRDGSRHFFRFNPVHLNAPSPHPCAVQASATSCAGEQASFINPKPLSFSSVPHFTPTCRRASRQPEREGSVRRLCRIIWNSFSYFLTFA